MTGKRNGRGAACVLLCVLWAGPSLADDADCFHFGYGLDRLGADETMPLGRINDRAPRTNFVKREDLQKGCPGANANCQEKRCLVPGDEVVITGRKADFVCVSYVDGKGRVTDGWMPSAAVTAVQDPPAVQALDWIGTWQSGPEQTIVIKPASKPGQLKINGDATWGASDPERVKRGSVNIGELDGETMATGRNLSFGMGENGTVPFDKADEADCKVEMRRLGPYLLAKDNGMCGGANVSFTGVYRRLK